MPLMLTHDLRFTRGATVLALAAANLSAQFSSPPGRTAGANAGNSSVASTQPFAASVMGRRFQYIVGDITAGPQTISTLALQSDAATTSVARNIDILLAMGHAPVGTALVPSTTFTANYVPLSETFVLDDGTGAHALQVSLPATPNGFDVITLPLNHTFAYSGTDELIVDFNVLNSTSTGAYSLDVESGTSTSVGSFTYNGLRGCIVLPNTSMQDIYGHTPVTVAGITTCSQHMDDGPVSAPGIMVIGLTDPNTTLNGQLCVPLRASLDVSTYSVTTDATGRIGSEANPIRLRFPDVGDPFTFYTQFVIVDLARAAPELIVSLSDGLKWDITPPLARPRRLIYSTASNQTLTGVSSTSFVPVLFFD